jgi:hypothetical protein
MIPIKKFFVLLCILSVSVCGAWSQTVKVKKEESRVKGENTDGYAVDLDGKPEEVGVSFNRYLKSLGKTRMNDGTYVLTESTINGAGYKNPIYGIVKEKGGKAQAWIGVRKADWPDGADNISKELEKLIYEFGVKFYKDLIQLQVDESIRALNAVEKQQQRLTTQGRDLNMKLEDNKREKIQLEKSIENNKLEYEALLKKIEKNKHDADSMVVVNEQVKKVVDATKEKQKKVN